LNREREDDACTRNHQTHSRTRALTHLFNPSYS
jgi:hypothetical protein